MKKENYNRINHQIKEKQIRLVGDNVSNSIVDIKDALKKSYELGLDLVEITEPKNSNYSICKIIDYKKYIYDQKKKLKIQKQKQKQNQVNIKEIRMTPNIDKHDLDFKLKHAINFLNNNDKVILTMFFKGRQITFKDKGEIVLLKFAENLEDVGVAENLPKLSGKKMSMIIKPKKK